MTESPVSCGRCGGSVEAGAVTVTVDGGPLHASNPLFKLCPHCAGRMADWYGQRRKKASLTADGPNGLSGPGADRESSSGGHRGRKHRRTTGAAGPWARKPMLTLGVLAVVALIMFLISYVIISNAARRGGVDL